MSTDKQQSRWERLQHRYRLVIMNDDTLEEQLSYKLTRLNIYILLSSITVLLVMITVAIIVITPLKEYIPGYGDTTIRRNILRLSEKSDSLQNLVLKQNAFIQNIENILNDNIDTTNQATIAGAVDPLAEDSFLSHSIDLDSISTEEMELRRKLEMENNMQVFDKLGIESEILGDINSLYFSPVKGVITDGFDIEKEHYGVDLVAKEEEPIKAIADGIIVFSDWTVETGYVVGIQHADDMLSFYKHNSVLLKKVGNFVNAGDVIAIIGNSGENSTGPHLHFELWHNQVPVNPIDYVSFN